MRPITMIEFFVIGVLVACLALHFAVQAEEPPITAREWMIQKSMPDQAKPADKVECYQVLWKNTNFTKMCITEMEWRRIHAEEIAEHGK